jgi:glycosyltransferase involved in cell wall biosynthesis
MKNILWISLRAPYDKVPHAGGKNHNFLLKNLYEKTDWDIYLISFCRPNEADLVDSDLAGYNIKNDISVLKSKESNLLIGRLSQKSGIPYSVYEYPFIISTIKSKLRKLAKKGYRPDLIMLQWTEIVMLLPMVRKIFSNARFVCIEEDVTFLKMQRKYGRAKGIQKFLSYMQLRILKHREILSIKKSDLTVLTNPKDLDLLADNNIPYRKLFEMVPYFQDLKTTVYHWTQDIILYYGAMNRPENEEAVIWFIRYVMPGLLSHNKNFKFIIVGANPSEKLLKKKSPNVIFTGFVEDVTFFFARCLCIAIPLQMGAGIKIKVLESMSAGVPVLTNDIGIEGIPARRGKDFLLCESSEDYVENIIRLQKTREYAEELSVNARKFISESYDRDKALMNLLNRMKEIEREK